MIIDPRLKTLDFSTKSWTSAECSYQFRFQHVSLSYAFFHAGDVLSIYNMTFNTCLVLQTKK